MLPAHKSGAQFLGFPQSVQVLITLNLFPLFPSHKSGSSILQYFFTYVYIYLYLSVILVFSFSVFSSSVLSQQFFNYHG